MNKDGLIQAITSGDADKRWQAVSTAGIAGDSAVIPLATLMAGKDPSQAKAAGEALKRIVHASARSDAQTDRKRVASELQKVAVESKSELVRRDAIHYLGLIGSESDVAFLAGLLSSVRLREDARMALERIDSKRSLTALMDAETNETSIYQKPLQQSIEHFRKSRRTIGIAGK